VSGKGQYTIEVLDVALDVLELLVTTEGRSLRPSEIAHQLGINRSRAFRILKTLERRTYVTFDPETKSYRLGFKCLQIGERVREQLDLRHMAEPVLRELAETTGDVALLVVRYGDATIDIASYRGHHVLQATVPIGQPFPFHIGASNKILLAYLPEPERERIIQEMELTPFTEKTITDRDELRRCLEEIRTQGYALDEEGFEVGVYAIGAPVRDYSGRVVAGVTVTTPQSRYSPQRREELIEMVVQAADRISARLGKSAN
jgi:DNA-binding IclR family transcriptional regulator